MLDPFSLSPFILLSLSASVLLSLLKLLFLSRRRPPVKKLVRSVETPSSSPQYDLPPCLSVLQSLVIPARSSFWPTHYSDRALQADASRAGTLTLSLKMLFDDIAAGSIELRDFEVCSAAFDALSHQRSPLISKLL